MNRSGLIVLILWLGSAVHGVGQPSDSPAGRVTTKSLDEQLFKDLDTAYPDSITPGPNADEGQGAGRNRRNLRQSSETRTNTFDDGEDIELTEHMDPLTRIGHRMRSAGRRLAKSDLSENTRVLQKQIVRELDQLIVSARKQPKQQPGGADPEAGRRPRESVDQPPRPDPQTDDPAQSRGSESQPRLDGTPVDSPARDQIETLLKKVWGYLPPQEQEQLLNTSVEDFLPKYKTLIEEYFKRLAEDERSVP